jgi:virginiamycin B lyase
MLKKQFVQVGMAGIAAILLFQPFAALGVNAPSPTALTGVVSSKEEGHMEGVLVSAKKEGSSVTITVVSDAQGGFGFPRAKLESGRYSLQIRAVGYELDDPGQVEISSRKSVRKDLNLHPTKDIAAQLTNAEWMLSIPGTEQQKTALLNCVSCHTLQRIVSSKHDTAEFLEVVQRMGGYANQSSPLHPQRRVSEKPPEAPREQAQGPQRQFAEYLSTINLSSAANWGYPLKTLPRPKGRATRVVITEYDLPRQTIEPHDVFVDSKGIVWYSNFGEQFLGKLDPKTAKYAEFPVPLLKPGQPTGVEGLRPDTDGNLWIGMMFQGALAKFDPKAEKFQVFSLPPELSDQSQVNMVSPEHAAVDGKVWLQNNGPAAIYRLDPATGKFDDFEPFKDPKQGAGHSIYDVIADSHNNVYFTDFADGQIGRIDAKTGQVTFFPTPTQRSGPRRGTMDSQDRFWFGEYRGNTVAMFDTRTEHFKEWAAPTPWSAPYDVALDKNGDAWTGSMVTDRVLRLNTQTGEFTEYLLPRWTNIRRVFVDNSTTPVTFWVGNDDGASIIKMEPLD